MAARLVSIAAIVVAAALARPRPASACSCALPMIEVYPRNGTAAPVNSRIRVFVPDDEVLEKVSPDLSKIEIAVRPKKGTSKRVKIKDGKKTRWVTKHIPAPAVEADRVVVGAGWVQVVELAPRAPLAPSTEYVVTMALPERDPELIGSFVTAASADTTPPRWAGVKKAWMQANRSGDGSCGTGDRHAVLTTSAPGGEDAVLIYGVWVAGSDGKIAWTDPPATYVMGFGEQLRLGRWSICQPSTFSFPTDRDSLILGVRAFDLAGNPAETAAEVVLDLKKR